jgi:hypothetical protein
VLDVLYNSNGLGYWSFQADEGCGHVADLSSEQRLVLGWEGGGRMSDGANITLLGVDGGGNPVAATYDLIGVLGGSGLTFPYSKQSRISTSMELPLGGGTICPDHDFSLSMNGGSAWYR